MFLPSGPQFRSSVCGKPNVGLVLALCALLQACEHTPPCRENVADVDVSVQPRLELPQSTHSPNHPVYVFGDSNSRLPPVLLLHELPGLSSRTLLYAQELSRHFTVYVPLLFGAPNQDGGLGMVNGLWNYAFNGEWGAWENSNREKPIIRWLLEVLEQIHDLHREQPIGIIGMCMTGAMPLALMQDAQVKAVVLAQPTLPLFGDENALGLTEDEWQQALHRVQSGSARVYGLRFEHDTLAPRSKHVRLQADLKSGFEDGEIRDAEYRFINRQGKVDRVRRNAHSTLVSEWCPDLPREHPVMKRRDAVAHWLRESLGAGSRNASE